MLLMLEGLSSAGLLSRGPQHNTRSGSSYCVCAGMVYPYVSAEQLHCSGVLTVGVEWIFWPPAHSGGFCAGHCTPPSAQDV